MKRKNRAAAWLLVCTLALSCALFGCTPSGDDIPPATSEPSEPSVPEEPVSDGSVTVKEIVTNGEVADEDTGTVLVSYAVSMPSLEGEGEGVAVINEYYETQREKYVTYARGLYDMAKEQLESGEGGLFTQYEANQYFFVNFNKNGYLSVLRLGETYTGGVHGSQTLYSESFETAGGGKLSMGDLFAVEESVYRQTMADMILAQIEEKELESELFDGYAEAVARFDSANFTLASEGVTIFYQEYDIAPGASGFQSFTLPYAGLEQIMKPEMYDALAS